MGTIHRFNRQHGAFSWHDVGIKAYPGQESLHVTKRELISKRDGAQHFEVRYFEVQPGGYTSLDTHQHDHGVVVLRGSGTVLLAEKTFAITFGDVVYIEPFEKHQFHNAGKEPLGFLCVIPPKP